MDKTKWSTLLLFLTFCSLATAQYSVCSGVVIFHRELSTSDYRRQIDTIYPENLAIDSVYVLEDQKKSVLFKCYGPFISGDTIDMSAMENYPSGWYIMLFYINHCIEVHTFRHILYSEPAASDILFLNKKKDRTYKYIRNGQVLIHRGDADYDLTGRKMELRE